MLTILDDKKKSGKVNRQNLPIAFKCAIFAACFFVACLITPMSAVERSHQGGITVLCG